MTIQQDPGRGIGWEQMGFISQMTGNLPEAVRYYEIAYGLPGNSIDRGKLKRLQDELRSRQRESR
jgi:cytochrome c-type biogenesis protein CcmH/NrfG